MFRAIEVFKVFNRKEGDIPCSLLASRGVMEATSIHHPEDKANLEYVMSSLLKAVQNDQFKVVNEEQALIKFSCFQPSEQGFKLLMMTAFFSDDPSFIVLLLDEEIVQEENSVGIN